MPEELLARLAQLEDSYYGDKKAAREKQFFDTYGSRFSNNRGLGLAILNELDARGIDTSAADEAVQQILDTLRTECNEIIESIKVVQENAIENAQKVEQIANVVADAVASNPESTMGGEPPAMEGMEVPPAPALDALDPDGEFNPDDVPADITGGEEEPAEEPPAEEPAPTDVTSDARLKRINRMKDHWGKTHTQKKAEKNGYKPSAGIISACGGN